jgi:hypothetical protein
MNRAKIENKAPLNPLLGVGTASAVRRLAAARHETISATCEYLLILGLAAHTREREMRDRANGKMRALPSAEG